MNENIRIVIIVVSELAVVASGVIIGNAIYTHTKVGMDKQALAISAGIGLVAAFFLTKYIKKT